MMTPSIKMIGMDLDGTLLNSDKKLSEYTKRVLTEAVEQGVIILPATGRPVTGIPKEVIQFPGVRYALTANGARLVDVQEDRILHEELLSYEEGVKLLQIFEKYDCYPEIYFDGLGYAEQRGLDNIDRYVLSKPMIEYVLSTRHAVEDIQEFFAKEHRPADKIQAFLADASQKDALMEEVKAALPKAAVTGALSNNVEVNAGEARKGVALVKLGEILGIAREEIMSFGDGSNDTDMILQAGLGVAMGNAIEEVKEAADYVTVTNDEDGVAKAIEKFVLR